MEFDKTTLAMQLKAITRYRGFTVKKLCAEYNQKNNTNYVPQSFSRKIGDEAFKFDELKNLGEFSALRLNWNFFEEV